MQYYMSRRSCSARAARTTRTCILSDFALENLMKGNYVGVLGAETRSATSPPTAVGASERRVQPGPGQEVAGRERFGIGKGTKIEHDRRRHVEHDHVQRGAAVQRGDRRGEQLVTRRARTATAAGRPALRPGRQHVPDSHDPELDHPGHDDVLRPAQFPQNHPNRLNCVQNRNDGNQWAAARSRHTGGVNAAFADGSVRFIRDSIDLASVASLGTKTGGEVVTID